MLSAAVDLVILVGSSSTSGWQRCHRALQQRNVVPLALLPAGGRRPSSAAEAQHPERVLAVGGHEP
jgi:hypothetical protein